jgi:tRNA (cytidine/uridine-2'-O-)-methyltransferase
VNLPGHGLKVVLVQPQIAPNTGNIARLCVATGTPLHLVRPMGFVLSDRFLRRSAMDYWDRLQLTVHDDDEALQAAAASAGGRLWLFTSKATRPHWGADFRDGDWLVFGSETRGLSRAWLDRYPEQTVRIPQVANERCLNLATAAGIGLYEALRQTTTADRAPA